MLPSIVRFDEVEESSGAPIFRKAIDTLCAFGANEPVRMAEFARLQQQLEAFWPDLDESTNPVASYAFDACVALGEALALVQEAEAEHVVHCATAARDTVDMYVQDVTDLDLPPAELNEFIDATPVMQQEVARQAATAQVLATASHLTATFIDQLRQQNRQEPLIDFARV
ncbi:hypothetical protein GCM10011383_43730 [Hymenobacter cavernae]|uniref:DUF416 family protein n=2 Tax=Hymenobacter cavernae TaxID=2044852 RepID=A0ABQ1UUR5_9BACT|nr:hypothetical protein GCM10011383_43730 [Hymenobacter cavernae]